MSFLLDSIVLAFLSMMYEFFIQITYFSSCWQVINNIHEILCKYFKADIYGSIQIIFK
jgi:hypothetical protein